MTPSDSSSEHKKDEEKWPLREVIFVEDVRSVPTGRVLKVDGHYAAVRFPSTHTRERDSKDVDDILQDCRLMRKDELQVIKRLTFFKILLTAPVMLFCRLSSHRRIQECPTVSKGHRKEFKSPKMVVKFCR